MEDETQIDLDADQLLRQLDDRIKECQSEMETARNNLTHFARENEKAIFRKIVLLKKIRKSAA